MTLLKNSFTIRWDIYDIIERAKQLGHNISENTAREIMEKIYYSHDCNIGINWDVIDTTISMYC